MWPGLMEAQSLQNGFIRSFATSLLVSSCKRSLTATLNGNAGLSECGEVVAAGRELPRSTSLQLTARACVSSPPREPLAGVVAWLLRRVLATAAPLHAAELLIRRGDPLTFSGLREVCSWSAPSLPWKV